MHPLPLAPTNPDRPHERFRPSERLRLDPERIPLERTNHQQRPAANEGPRLVFWEMQIMWQWFTKVLLWSSDTRECISSGNPRSSEAEILWKLIQGRREKTPRLLSCCKTHLILSQVFKIFDKKILKELISDPFLLTSVYQCHSYQRGQVWNRISLVCSHFFKCSIQILPNVYIYIYIYIILQILIYIWICMVGFICPGRYK